MSDIELLLLTKKGLAGKADLVGGKIPVSQLPGYVDDVVEGYYFNGAFYTDAEHTDEITPEANTIYHDIPTDAQYRWGGTSYVMISGAVTKAEVEEMLEEKADIDGYYAGSGLGAATAENLIDVKNPGVLREYTEDTTAGAASVSDVGVATIKEIQGNTLKWNQGIGETEVVPETFEAYEKTVPAGAKAAEVGSIGGKTVVWNQTSPDYSGTYIKATTRVKAALFNVGAGVKSGHKYLIRFALSDVVTDATGQPYPASIAFYKRENGDATQLNMHIAIPKSDWKNGTVAYLVTATETAIALSNVSPSTDGAVYFYVYLSSLASDETAATIRDPIFIDLTQHFGAGSEPTDTSDPRIAGIIRYAEEHPEYDAGSLLSAKVTSIVSKDSAQQEIGALEIPAALRTFLADKGYGWSAGTVYNELNLEAKKYIQRVGSVDLGTLNWNHNGTQADGSTQFIAPVDGRAFSELNLICAEYITQVSVAGGTIQGRSNSNKVTLNSFDFSTAGEVKSALSGKMLLYELATPIEYDISSYLPEDHTLTVEAGGTLTFLQDGDTQLQVPVTLDWTKDTWTKALDSTHKYILMNAGTKTYISGQSSVSIPSGQHKSLIDLSLMFGSGNEPATVAEFEKFFPLDWYAQNGGTVIGYNGTGIKTVGYNAFNLATGKAELLGGHQYEILGSYTGLSYSTGESIVPSSSLFTPTKNGTLTITGGDDTTCVHLTWSGYRNGDYEAYWEQLREIPISTYFPNGMHSIGDVHDALYPDRAVQKIGYRAYEDGDEDDEGVITDGTNTIYVLDTPVVTNIESPLNFTLRVDDFGTETSLPINGDEPTTTPLKAMIAYGMDFAREVVTIRENYIPKVTDAVNGDIASFDANGQLVDSGVPYGSVVTQSMIDQILLQLTPGAYEGVDLTLKFATEIAAPPYSGNPWAWIKARITAKNYLGIHYRDYIPVTCTNGNVLKMQVMGINTYKGAGDTEIGDHIDFISKDCWPGAVTYNPVNYNNGLGCDKFSGDGETTAFQLCHRTANTYPALGSVTVNGTTADASTYTYDSTTGLLEFAAAPASAAVIKAVWATAEACPFLVSNAYAFLNSEKMGVPNEAAADPLLTEVDYTAGGVWYYLPDNVKSVIAPKRFLAGSRYTANTLRTSESTWGWKNLGRLWLPDEMEVFGARKWGGNYTDGFGRPYPGFSDGNRRKGDGDGRPRAHWWLLTTNTSSTNFCFVALYGGAGSDVASYTYARLPVCFRITG